MTQPDPWPAAPSRPVGPRHRRRRFRLGIIIGVAAVVVLAVAATAIYLINIDRSVTRNITRGIDLPSETASPGGAPTAEPETGTLNYVLLGSDSRDPDNEGNGRSDSIMVVHLNAKRNKAYIISFPRDMYVAIPGYGHNKINSAYSFGGAPLIVRTLQDLTGVKMDHVVVIDFDGFIQLTDDLGGVTVINKTAFSSHGYDYAKGKITIQGHRALWFVRERHSLPGGDLERAENQRNVIKAIVEKGLSAGVISDPAKFTTFLGNVAKHLTVDNSLSDSEIRSTAFSLRLSAKNIILMQAPLSGFRMIGGQSVDQVDTVKMAELNAALKKDDLAAYVKKYPPG
jgi:LCP family protein required for cell wall assembly